MLNTEIKEYKIDPLVSYLTECLSEACFDIEPDGTMFCSDSNAMLDPHKLAKHIREILGVPWVE